MNVSFNNPHQRLPAPSIRHAQSIREMQHVTAGGEIAALERAAIERAPGEGASREGASREGGASEGITPGRGESFDEDSLKMWWQRIHQYPLLSAEREIELARRIETGDERAFDEMVESNLRLVGSIARKCRRYAGTSLPLADLIQEGNVGLMRAVRKFDHRRGYKFSTYATYWIRQAVMRSIDEQSRSIRLPVHIVESMSRADRARSTLTQELERPPTEKELAAHLKVSERKVQDVTVKTAEPLSLEMSMGDGDESVLMDFIEDKGAPSPVDCASRVALREEIERAFSCLSQREAEVLTLRYGLDGSGQDRTLDEVGACLHLTRERIRQIEKTALKRLKRSAPLRETARGYGALPASDTPLSDAPLSGVPMLIIGAPKAAPSGTASPSGTAAPAGPDSGQAPSLLYGEDSIRTSPVRQPIGKAGEQKSLAHERAKC